MELKNERARDTMKAPKLIGKKSIEFASVRRSLRLDRVDLCFVSSFGGSKSFVRCGRLVRARVNSGFVVINVRILIEENRCLIGTSRYRAEPKKTTRTEPAAISLSNVGDPHQIVWLDQTIELVATSFRYYQFWAMSPIQFNFPWSVCASSSPPYHSGRHG